MQMKRTLFLDTSYAIALSSRNDGFHQQAITVSTQIEQERSNLVTTRAITLEIGNALSRLRYRHVSIALLESLEQDASIEIVPISEPLYRRAFDLYRSRPDKDWGLTDCLSFVVMKDREISEALTADEHFQQAGFQALLRKT